MTHRGRPPLLSEETILDSALSMFASVGYEAMSVRALNNVLGVSHETVTKRFGPKSDLFRAALHHGARKFISEFDAEVSSVSPSTELEKLRAIVRAFIITTSHHPTLGDLLHHKNIVEKQRILIFSETGFAERINATSLLLKDLHKSGEIREVQMRELWFLAQGGAAPLHFHALSQMFDQFDGPINPSELIERMTDAIMRSLMK
jgi:AcrR family transcriptional regulator